jgi:imidazoleglycerol-phosphate dehydratase/histidinol-phosphatase
VLAQQSDRQRIDRAAVLALAAALAGRALLVVDEAYVEFSGRRRWRREVAAMPGLVVLRTLSKAHGLAGARCGAVLGHPEVIALLRRVIQPYAVSQLTIEAVFRALEPAALDEARERVQRVIGRTHAPRRRARRAQHGAAGLAQRGEFPAGRFRGRGRGAAARHAAGLLVRDLRHLPSLPQALRLSIGTPEQNDRLLVPAMSSHERALPTLFIDRDGTLIEEPADEQVDALDKIRFVPGVFAALANCGRPGTAWSWSQPGRARHRVVSARHFDRCQDFILLQPFLAGHRIRRGVHLSASRGDGCSCRKPQHGLLREWLAGMPSTPARSAVIGDRDTDLEFAANWACAPARAPPLPAAGPKAGRRSCARCWRAAPMWSAARARPPSGRGRTRRTRRAQISTGIGFFDHMLEQLAKHGGFGAAPAMPGRPAHRRAPHGRGLRARARRGAAARARRQAGIGRYGFLLAMDEARRRSRSICPAAPISPFEGRFGREQVGALPTELVPHFFRSLSDSAGRALHLTVRGENTHHMIEACFKGVGRALRPALRREGTNLPSTKGVL